jgi:D-hydroxyproline dehydrogenase subunit beta
VIAPSEPDVIVVGAGIVGAACAQALAHHGMRVLVLDAGIVGGGTTAAGMGHVVVMDDSPEQLALTSYSAALWREARARLPAAVEYDACGTIWVAENDAQVEAVRDKQRVYGEVGVDAQMLSAGDLARMEPNLRSGLAGGLRVPGDAVVYPPRAALAYMEAAIADGAELREGCRVDEIVEGGVRAGGNLLRARIVINAAGAEAGRLTPSLPIVPRKGHLAITDRYPGFCRHQLVELGYLTSAHTMNAESVAFNVQPRSTQQVLIGSSRELVGWDASTNLALLKRMLERAQEFMPTLAGASVIRTWTGFRPATTDKLPLIGELPDMPGVWVAAGHEGLGITTSLGTAQLIGDMVMGRSPAIDPLPFSPRRLAGVHSGVA